MVRIQLPFSPAVQAKKPAAGKAGQQRVALAVTADTVHFSGSGKTEDSQRTSGVQEKLIRFDPQLKTFTLSGKDMEYQIHITPQGELVNLHWGKPVGKVYPELSPHKQMRPNSWQQELDFMPREFPDAGRADNRTPALKIVTASGDGVSHFKYVSHQVRSGKSQPQDLPGLRVNPGERAQTLIIKLRDEKTKLEMNLSYTVFADRNIVVRSAQIANKGDEPVQIEKLASFSADFNADDYRLLSLSGASIRERQEQIEPLSSGKKVISSNLGASGHVHNPFVALLEKDTTEETGNVYGFGLVYSGSFSAEAEKNRTGYTRVVMGLNPEAFRWKLAPGETFQTPEAIGVFSDEGLGGLTRQMHSVVHDNIIRSPWKDKPRPVLLNTWEAIHWNVNHEKVVEMAKEAKTLGVDLVVLDDGWFGDRFPRSNVDALGDWVANPEKFPEGVNAVGKAINEMGLDFGIWFEPEMVSPRSELFEQHPDWIIHQPNRFSTPVKNQYILDLGRPEVQDYLIESISKILDGGHIQYVKWDMNRTMTEIGSAGLPGERQGETQHRYMLGLYRVLETLTAQYPDVLFEGCAGGGGRFDLGMLQYFPQMWTSDNTDAMARLNIQAGTGRIYPAMTMGSHVSPVPNGQLNRMTSLKTRFHVAMSANLGLELDPAELTPPEKALAREQIALYKEKRHIIQDGDYHLLSSPFESNWPAWMFSSRDGSEALVFAFQKMAEAATPTPTVKLKGLDEEALYEVSGIEQPLSGAYLMHKGLVPAFNTDFDSQLFIIKKRT